MALQFISHKGSGSEKGKKLKPQQSSFDSRRDQNNNTQPPQGTATSEPSTSQWTPHKYIMELMLNSRRWVVLDGTEGCVAQDGTMARVQYAAVLWPKLFLLPSVTSKCVIVLGISSCPCCNILTAEETKRSEHIFDSPQEGVWRLASNHYSCWKWCFSQTVCCCCCCGK